jgi:hypothetical protein
MGNPDHLPTGKDNMSDTPKKTLTINRKPATGTAAPPTPAPAPGSVTRTGKRIIRRGDLPQATPAKGKPPATGKGGKPASNKRKPSRKPATKKPVIAPSDLKARELNDRLNGFPVWLNFQPLVIGVEKEVYRLVNDEHFPGASKKVVQKTLMRHTRHARYLQALVRGGERFRLDGSPDGEIDSHQQQFAAQLLAGKETQGITIVQNIPSQQRNKVIDTK